MMPKIKMPAMTSVVMTGRLMKSSEMLTVLPPASALPAGRLPS